MKTLETLDRWCFKQTFLTLYPQVLYQNRRTCCFLFEIDLHVRIVKYLLKIWRKLRLELILTKSQSWYLQFSQIFILGKCSYRSSSSGEKLWVFFRFMITSRFLIFITSLALIKFSNISDLNDNLRSYRWTVSGTS